MKRLFLLLLIAISLTSCEKKFGSLSEIDQDVLFKVEYINAAWGYQHNGFLIDKNGIIYEYENPEEWNFAGTGGYISKADMEENLAKVSESDCTVSESDLLNYFNKLHLVDPDLQTRPEYVMADAGAKFYTGYKYESKSEMYREVLLLQEGDVFMENTSRDAKRIVKWLEDLCE